MQEATTAGGPMRRYSTRGGGEEKASAGKWHVILGTETSETEIRLRRVEGAWESAPAGDTAVK